MRDKKNKLSAIQSDVDFPPLLASLSHASSSAADASILHALPSMHPISPHLMLSHVPSDSSRTDISMDATATAANVITGIHLDPSSAGGS